MGVRRPRRETFCTQNFSFPTRERGLNLFGRFRSLPPPGYFSSTIMSDATIIAPPSAGFLPALSRIIRALQPSVGVLQLTHLAGLVFVPVAYTVFRMLSQPHDHMRTLVSVVFVLAGSLWSSGILVYGLLTGSSEAPTATVLQHYRKLLLRRWFLVATDLLLLVGLGLLLHQILGYRQVAFVSSRDCDLYTEDAEGEAQLLGTVKARQVTLFRLHVGEQEIMVAPLLEPEMQKELLPAISVLPYWSRQSQARVETNCGRS